MTISQAAIKSNSNAISDVFQMLQDPHRKYTAHEAFRPSPDDFDTLVPKFKSYLLDVLGSMPEQAIFKYAVIKVEIDKETVVIDLAHADANDELIATRLLNDRTIYIMENALAQGVTVVVHIATRQYVPNALLAYLAQEPRELDIVRDHLDHIRRAKESGQNFNPKVERLVASVDENIAFSETQKQQISYVYKQASDNYNAICAQLGIQPYTQKLQSERVDVLDVRGAPQLEHSVTGWLDGINLTPRTLDFVKQSLRQAKEIGLDDKQIRILKAGLLDFLLGE